MTAAEVAVVDCSQKRSALLHELLERTSRTFALAIPLLPQPTHRTVTTAYLLFRIADTFEDATILWTRQRRIEALADFEALMLRPETGAALRHARSWLDSPPSDHQGYVDLIGHTPDLVCELLAMEPTARDILATHTARTARGMAGYVSGTDGHGVMRLASLEELREYCYIVAGIVGELLTELFVHDAPQLQEAAPRLRPRAPLFGEALQLVNILRDSTDDRTEGRAFVPSGVDRSEVFALAREDLIAATEYCRILQRHQAPTGFTAFCALPVGLARATLDVVEQRGPGSKLTRPQVFELHAKVQSELEVGRPVLS